MPKGINHKKIFSKGSTSSGGGSGYMLSSTYDPQSFTDACLFGFQEIAVNDAQYMVSTNTVWNLRDQPIKIVSGTTSLPTGIHHVLTKIIFNPSNQYRFDNVGEAWVTALGRYVPCTYDVVSNEIHYSLTATILFTGFATIGSYEVLENNLGATLGTLTWDTDKWKIPVSADIAKGGDVKYVDVNIGTARSTPFVSITPYAWYDNSGTNNIYFSAVDAASTYNDDLWSSTPIKITITAQF